MLKFTTNVINHAEILEVEAFEIAAPDFGRRGHRLRAGIIPGILEVPCRNRPRPVPPHNNSLN